MDMMTKVDDATAFIRTGNGVFKQVDVFVRGERLFIPASGGYVRVCAPFGDTWTTTHPSIKVLEMEGDQLDLTEGREPGIKAKRRGR